jgi:parvulin-like peptidyl-prolyl isomerase
MAGAWRTHALATPAVVLLLSSCVISTHAGVGAELDVPPTPKPVRVSEGSSEANEAQGPDLTTPEEKITARHILVSYRGALRAAPHIVRSREEAFTRAQEALGRAGKGEPFDRLAEDYSADLGSAAKGGSLGEFSRQDMVAEFAEAAFSLEPGQLSEIVETPFGFHVILREE